MFSLSAMKDFLKNWRLMEHYEEIKVTIVNFSEKKYWTHKLAFYVFGFCSKDFPEFLQDDRTLRRTRKNKSRCKIHVSSLAGIFSVFLPFGKQCILVGTVITFISQLLNKGMLTFSWFWFKSNHSGIIISRWKACLTL